jgi:hypothetical protein
MTGITELNEPELLWLGQLLDELTAEGIGLDAFAVSEYFDRRRAEWAAHPDLAGDPNLHINRVGAAVGEILVRSAGLRWVIASDEYGTELAVHGQPGDILAYPMNAVAKRWTGENPTSVEELLRQTMATITRLRGS